MSYAKFKKLHQQQILVLGNVWDAHSAKIAQDTGFSALGTSSHAIANLLGYNDGEQIPVEELLYMVERIVKSVKIPVSVDFESGYTDKPSELAILVKRLTDIGVVGINLEDGKVGKGGRKLGKAALLVDKIQAIKAETKNIFINARTDTFTTQHATPVEESIARIAQYENAGADGIFVPLVESKKDIQRLVAASNLPLNVFLTPKLPKLQELETLGVKRLSHGAKIYEWLVTKNTKVFQDFLQKPSLPK